MEPQNTISENRISFRDIIERIKHYLRHLIGKWKVIVLGSFLLASLYWVKEVISDPIYQAETTFVLDEGGQSQLAQVSSLASSLGFNFGSMGGNEGIFQIDNIVELYRSTRMLKMTFLSQQELDGRTQRLITRFAEDKKLAKRWKRKLGEGFTFEIPDDELTIQHDSLLFEVFEDFREDQMVVKKLDRKLTILTVQIFDRDQLFAQRFNEVLVANVNKFYLETKTKKSGDNLAILQYQADSAKIVLEQSLDELARVSESTPNPNPIYQRSRTDVQKAMIKVETSAAVYEELIKNLEIAKITHRNNEPLIQIIDEPILPLRDDKDSLLKMIVKGGFFSGIFVLFAVSLRYIYWQAVNVD